MFKATGPFTIDLTRKPKETTDTLPDGKQIKGIYELDGDTLKWAANEPGKTDRPKEFESKEGSERLLLTLKRDK